MWSQIVRHSNVSSVSEMGPRPTFGPKHPQWGSCMDGLRVGQSMTSASCCVRKAVVYCVGCGVVLDIHKVSSKIARSAEKHTFAEKPDVALTAKGSIQHHQSTPSIMMDDTLYHDWGATVTVHGLDAGIYQSFPFPVGHTSKQWESISIVKVKKIWHNDTWSASAQVTVYCLTAPIHYMIQIWHIVSFGIDLRALSLEKLKIWI